MRRYLYLLLFAVATMQSWAQVVWHDPMKCGYEVVQNQAFADEIGEYQRLPLRAQDVVRLPVWNLAQNSAGLAIHFYTNSPTLEVRYKTTSRNYAMNHMPATGVSGVDLYRIDYHGKWESCEGNYSFGEQVVFKYIDLVDAYHKRGFEYRLYLPLYNGVQQLEIGVQEGAKFSFIPVSCEKPIVIYGTSIAQGGCASRPAMAWGSILQRSVDYPVVNLGFSGNGRLETEVIDFINEIDARLYILDCIPNLTSHKDVEQRVINAVKQIRSKHDEPILLIEHPGYANDATYARHREMTSASNKASRKAYEALVAEGVADLYYISQAELGCTAEMMVDYIHLTDYGMKQQASVVERRVREIFQIPLGGSVTTIPVTQRREPGAYEWRERHESILKQVEAQPKNVILGNSIVHYWGGAHRQQNGREVWAEKMGDFVNMGYGWDRIENLLWRVYHGELDGFQAEKIIVMIGTNNLDRDSDEEIVKGVRFLLDAIRVRQPKAQITYVGLLPRRDREQRVKTLNKQLKAMAKESGYDYVDAGRYLLQKDGKIDESLFLDGLHPNNDGYARIVDYIKE